MMINYKYCPQCKSNLDTSTDYPHCNSCNKTFYKNSIPCCGVLPIKDGKVLLLKRAKEPFKGEYDIVGGILDDGESPYEGVIRETKEETGLDIKPTKIFGIYMDDYADGRNTLNIHYLGKVIGGKLKPGKDELLLKWFPIEKAPTDKGFNNTRQVLKDLKKWYSKNSHDES